ncbi:MAG: PAS domain S-box protein [candidate division Zixibacteria bacterium]|nr:PAS domain S-box protein [candidate division Zixibacteria bacterium]
MPPFQVDYLWAVIAGSVILIILAVALISIAAIHHYRIRDAEQKFKLLFNKLFDAIILINRGCFIIDVNDSACNMFGYTYQEFTDLRLGDLLVDGGIEKFQPILDRIRREGAGYLKETVLKDKNGKTFSVESGWSCLELGGEVHMVISIRDITERKQAENTIKAKSAELQKNHEELQRKNIALEEVLEHIEADKEKLKKQIATNIDRVLIPAVNKISKQDGLADPDYLNLVKKGLQELSNSTGGILHSYSKLTPREVEICSLIKVGNSSQEIADKLNISLDTVHNHRKSIRKKLGITGKDDNLVSYLNRL